MNNLKQYMMLLMLVMTISSPLQAEPVVLYDSGLAVSAVPYLQKAKLLPPSTATLNKQIAQQLKRLQAMTPQQRASQQFANLFPVKSPSLSPGKVISRDIDSIALDRPICVVGNDALSRDWLSRVSDKLMQAGAVCLAVNIDSALAFASLRQLSPELLFQPVSGDDIMRQLGIFHYPVVISNDMIEQ